MANQDWEKFGEDISRTVQEAIDAQDFNRLNQTITNTVNNAMNTLGKSIHDVGDVVDKTAQSFQKQARRDGRRAYRDAYRYNRQAGPGAFKGSGMFQGEHIYKDNGGGPGANAGPGTGFNGQQNQAYGSQPYRSQGYRSQAYQRQDLRQSRKDSAQEGVLAVQKNPGLFVKTSGAKAGGIAMSVTGYTLGIAMFLLFVFSIITLFFTSDTVQAGVLAFSIFSGIMFTGGGVLAGIGTALLGRVKRYRLYLSTLGDKEYCEIKELAGRLKKSHKYVVKDIQKMIRRGWFKQGHLDSQKTCLIVSNDAFTQYNELMQRMEKQKLEEKLSREKQAKAQKKLDPEVQEIIRTGDEYIKKIHESNDAIPGEEISAKISRMEVLVDRIFDRVEQNPESVTDIRRLMEYYLPTTVKLLEAYEQLDGMPVQGENIISSKNEIEKTLDTLNAAFEKLLDSLFQDTAWDVAADISVLNTMLAQEGLTKDDF